MNSGYEGLEAIWHDLFWEAEDAPSEVLLIDDFLQDKDGQGLYVGSGSGRLLGPLVGAGHDLIGLEISPEMADLSREKFPEAEVTVESWQEHEGTEKYAAIVIPAFTFQLFLEPLKQLRRLREQSDHLYLTLFFPWAEITGDLPAKRWYFDRSIELASGESGELETSHRISEQKGTLTRKHRYTLRGKDGEVLRQEETKQQLRFFSDLALKKLLESSGWELVREVQNLGEGDDDDLVYVTTLYLTGSKEG